MALRIHCTAIHAMTGYHEIKARLGAARMVFENPDSSAEARKSMSNLQANAALDSLAKFGAELSPEESAELANFAAAVNWAPGDIEHILKTLSGATSPPPSKKRRAQQDFRKMTHYFIAAELVSLTKPTSKDGRLQMILGRAWQLGLRTPSEFTLKLMNSMWILAVEPSNIIDGMGMSAKLTHLTYVKTEFDKLRKAFPADTAVWFDVLPEPLDMLSTFPALFNSVFPDGLPVPPHERFLSDLMKLDLSYTCRGGVSKANKVDQAMQQLAPVDSGAQLAGVMMQFMQNMMGSRGSGSGSLPSIHIPGEPTRRLPTITCGHASPHFRAPQP